ncbi:hypothetical protein [Microlunatus sp. Gsoil 973]|uniref:hypothetical protein n=1 Tax=Microlunatus sp. Gsoil 973 TaxID=2672569 RepID=UPI0012B4D983|nr:hypothetical protein [Microlunatus sp. Gsoil 973]QGN33841.1 hypothetical protein GJV80_14605 [Microlunatus sp. Gsoil 973]
MGGVMRPVGPESAETYWVRRAVVVGVMLLLLIIVLIFLVNLGGSPGQAAAPPTHSAIPAVTPSATPSATALTSGSGTGSALASATPSASPTLSPSPTPGSTQTPTGSSPTADSTQRPSATASARTSAKSPAKTSATATPTSKDSKGSDKGSTKNAGKPAGPAPKKPSASASPDPACTADQLAGTLKSKTHTVDIGAKVTFEVSYVNRSDQSCSLAINPDDYRLRIYSGSDRIWSTEDCTRLVHKADTTLEPGEGVGWSVTWNGKRSAQDETCANRPETPRPGYYHALSRLKGAPARDYLLILK